MYIYIYSRALYTTPDITLPIHASTPTPDLSHRPQSCPTQFYLNQQPPRPHRPSPDPRPQNSRLRTRKAHTGSNSPSFSARNFPPVAVCSFNCPSSLIRLFLSHPVPPSSSSYTLSFFSILPSHRLFHPLTENVGA